MNTKRQQLILELLTTQDVRTQKQLLDLLEAHGMKCTQSTVVVKTIHSMAQAVCAYIDKLNPDGFVGSIAGVDTILLILRTEEAAKTFCRTLSDYLCSGELFLEHENGGENA